MAPNWLMVLIGGAIGAPLRYLTGAVFKARYTTTIPWGTFIVNIAASFILAFFYVGGTRGTIDTRVGYLLDNGFCGALSTWSTFSYELLTLTTGSRVAAAGWYLLASVGFGMGASYAAAALARAVF